MIAFNNYILSITQYLAKRMRRGSRSSGENKIAFHSKTKHPQTGYTQIRILVLWPWPWPDGLDIQIWPTYDDDVPTINFLGQGFQKLEHYRKTDRQTHRHMQMKTFAGGNNSSAWLTLYDTGQVRRVGRHTTGRMFAVAGVQLATTATGTATVDRLGRATSTAACSTIAPQVGPAVDARDVEERNAFQWRSATQIQRASVTLYHHHSVTRSLHETEISTHGPLLELIKIIGFVFSSLLLSSIR